MTSVHNGKAGGTAQEFVTSEGFPWKDEFNGLTAGSKEFDKQWEKLADDHPEEFEKLQDKFIYDTHYVPVAKSVKEYGLDADKQSKTLQQVFWSTGVQHGPNTDVVKKAVENLKKENRFDPTSGEFEADLIDAIYEERKTRFESYSEEKQQVIKNRFDREKRDALNALKNERGKSDE